MFVNQRGPMYDWLQTQRDMSDCRNLSPVAMLRELGALSDRFIAVHGNSLTDEDIGLLAEHTCSVVHCPRSHDYFRHPPFPLEKLQNAGVNVCLGTDSLASVRGTNRSTIELNMFTEMQVLAKANPDISAEEIVRMVTINGAKALRRETELGHVSPGMFADMVAIPAPEDCNDVFTCIVENTAPASAVFVNGEQRSLPTN